MNMKMKTLSLALVGLAGFGFAGAAAAGGGCPGSPVPPWSSQSALGGSLVISDGGLDTSACKLDASMVANVPGSAFVRDDSPASEPTYRAQFMLNVDALGTIGGVEAFKVYAASTSTAVQGIVDLVKLTVKGNLAGTQTFLDVQTPCTGQAGNLCVTSLPIASGTNTVEIQWVKGTGGSADGTVSVWINGNDENSPTYTVAANNGAWSGVDYTTLGISTPSVSFRQNHLNQIVSVDTFDSRRTTFIGL